MEIAFDNSESHRGAPSTGATWSHTITGDDPYLVVSASMESTSINVDTCTYDGDACAEVIEGVTNYGNHIHAKIAPAAGTANVVVTLSSSTYNMCVSASYTGVDQTTPVEATSTSSGNSATPSDSITTLTDGAWIYGLFGADRAISGGTGITEIEPTVSNQEWAGDYDVVTAEAHGMSVVISAGARAFGTCSIAFKPAGGGGGFTPTPMSHHLQMASGLV